VNTWPDSDGAAFLCYVKQLHVRSSITVKVYHCILRGFQRFVVENSPDRPPCRRTIEEWLYDRSQVLPFHLVIHHARLVDCFLEWLVTHKLLVINPVAELRKIYGQRVTTPIVRALLSPDPNTALDALRPLPRFGSHLGPVMREQVTLMRALGYRYKRQEGEFLRFDRFLQSRPDLTGQSITSLVREYANVGSTVHHALECLQIERALAKALSRTDSTIVLPRPDRLLMRRVREQYRRPYIYTHEEVQHLLATALSFPSPQAPLRPLSLYTMIVLAYCVGLRLGEIVRLTVGDIHLDEEAIEIRETKFFKSRRLPVTPSVMAVLRKYMNACRQAGAPSHESATFFRHQQGNRGYSYVMASKLLVRVLRRAGLKPLKGRIGPRIHDFRHAFVVHRMMAWYRAGINPQERLPYLATYLGHKDINSTLIYLTVTKELLQAASDRFRSLGAKSLLEPEGGNPCA
jgi:integrase